MWTSEVGVKSIIQSFLSAFCKAELWKMMANYLVRKLLQFFSSFLSLNHNWNNLYSCNLTLTLQILTAEVQLVLDIRISLFKLEMPSWKWRNLSEGNKWDITQSVAAPVSQHEFILMYCSRRLCQSTANRTTPIRVKWCCLVTDRSCQKVSYLLWLGSNIFWQGQQIFLFPNYQTGSEVYTVYYSIGTGFISRW